jgi:hypothetical protein
MRTSRIDAGLVEECARDYQVTPRSVRTWRLKDDRRWREWLQKRAGQQSALPSLDFVTEAPEKMTLEDEEAQALRRYAALSQMCDAALSRNDHVSLTPLLRSAEQAHRLLHAVRENIVELKLKTGLLVHVEEAQKQINLALGPWSQGLRVMPAAVSKRVNPDNPDLAFMVLQEECGRILRLADDSRLESPVPNSARNSASLSGF